VDPAVANDILAKADAFLLEMSKSIKPATIEIKQIEREEEYDEVINEES
jgi:hypothetical protein